MTSDQIVRDIAGQPVIYLGEDEKDPLRVVLRFGSEELVMPRTQWEQLPLWSGSTPASIPKV